MFRLFNNRKIAVMTSIAAQSVIIHYYKNLKEEKANKEKLTFFSDSSDKINSYENSKNSLKPK